MTSPLTCTIVARNYLAQARVLARSFAEHHPGERLRVLIVDDRDGEVEADGEPFEIVPLAALPLDLRTVHEMAACYEVMEFATALKPSLLLCLLEQAGHRPVAYLDPDIMVFSSLDELVDLGRQHPIVLTPHSTVPVPRDGCQPSPFDILASGCWNLGFVSVTAAARPFLEWWAAHVRYDAVVDHAAQRFTDQRCIDLAPGYFDVHPLRHPGFNVAYWNADHRRVDWSDDVPTVNGQPLVFFHFSAFDTKRPYLLSRHQGERPRVRLSERPDIDRLCRLYAARLAEEGRDAWSDLPYGWSHLPDGTRLRPNMRAATRKALAAIESGERRQRPPDPFDEASVSDYLGWLAAPEPESGILAGIPRLFAEIWSGRRDLCLAYPYIDAVDAPRFRDWAQLFCRAEEDVPDAVMRAAFAEGGWPAERAVKWSPAGTLKPGFLVAGYLEAELGIGEAARRALRVMRTCGLPSGSLPFGITRSGRHQSTDAGADAPSRVDLNTNVIWVNADQLPFFVRTVGQSFFDGRYTVANWAWETETVQPEMREMSRLLDEIWTPSEFSAAALRQATDRRVHVFGHPIVAPDVDPAIDTRALGMPDGFVFLFIFDFLSTLARKNPLGLVEAFSTAFSPGEGPTLVLKAINGRLAALEVERLRYAMAGRPDIVLVDEYYTGAECAAMTARADCYVSLHRAEGFGLTLAEAMALGTPVVATEYSGNLDFMDRDTAYLVPASPAVVDADAPPYRKGDVWAEPDVGQAAELLRRVVDHPDEAAARAARGRRRVLVEHGPAQAARFLTERFGAIQEALASGYESRSAGAVEELISRVG